MDVFPGGTNTNAPIQPVGTARGTYLGLERFTSHVIQDIIYLDMGNCFVLDIINGLHPFPRVKVKSRYFKGLKERQISLNFYSHAV